MRSATCFCCLSALCAVLACCAAAHSQQSEEAPSVPATSAPEAATGAEAEPDESQSPTSTEEKPQPQLDPTAAPWEKEVEPTASGPDVYLLPDAEGKLRKVLGFRYEDFLRAWQQKANLQGAQPPRYRIESLKTFGEADESTAHLTITMEIVPRVDGWISVPLQLPTFLIQTWQLSDQADQESLTFDEKQHSHVLWLHNESNKPRTLTLEGMSKLKLGPTSPGIEIKLPYSATSEFVLRVPIANAQFDASAGVDLETAPSEDGSTQVKLTGKVSPLRLQWKSPEQRELSGSAAVDAAGQLTVSVGQRSVQYETALSIDSHGKPVERLRVKLPTGAQLSQGQFSEAYHVLTSPESSATVPSDIVEIELRQPPREPWTLRLRAEQPRKENDQESPCKIEGFEVLDAFRQTGTVALYADERLQAYFDLRGDVEQVPNRDSLQQTQLGALIGNFSYARFPWGLDVHTIARRQRTSVKPQYELQINPGEAKLLARLDYEFAGAQMFSVRVDLRGWELTDSPIESNGAVEGSGILEKEQGLLILPLADPEAQRVRIGMTLRRKTQLGHATFPLPEPLSATILPGQLSVKPDLSLQVTPTIVSTEGVSAVSAAKETQPEESAREDVGEQEALSFRTFLARATLGADVAQRERQITVDVQTRVDVSQEQIAVSQQLKYLVKYRPVSQLLLQIPEPLWQNKTLQVKLDGEEVPIGLGIFSEETPLQKPSQDSQATATPVRRLVVSLPRPMQNSFVLDLSYEIPNGTLAADASVPIELPLVAPHDQIEANQVSVRPQEPIRATLNQTIGEVPWNIGAASERLESDSAVLELRGSGKPTALPLLLQIDSQEDVELASLEFAWLQSWIVGELRQERAVFRFRSPQQTVFAQLPVTLGSTEIEVLLDGAPTNFELLGTRIAVKLPENEDRISHILELRYQNRATLAGWGPLHTKLPFLESRPSNALVFWQLILPQGWHAVGVPKPFHAEHWLGWKDYRWGRQPTYNQFDLESFAGATHAPLPPSSSNQYLYRALEVSPGTDVLVVRKTWIVLTSSLIAFGVGMLLIYTPLATQGLFWLLIALALCACVAIYPEVTLLAVQAILFGGAMTIITLLLRKTFGRTAHSESLTVSIGRAGSTAVTESWIHGQAKDLSDVETETASLQAGGSIS